VELGSLESVQDAYVSGLPSGAELQVPKDRLRNFQRYGTKVLVDEILHIVLRFFRR
jgi:hypothetical protein